MIRGRAESYAGRRVEILKKFKLDNGGDGMPTSVVTRDLSVSDAAKYTARLDLGDGNIGLAYNSNVGLDDAVGSLHAAGILTQPCSFCSEITKRAELRGGDLLKGP